MPAETLQTLENRLGKIEDLRSVVTTMKSLAAVNIRHFQGAAEASEEYRKNVLKGFHVLSFQQRFQKNGGMDLTPREPEERVSFVVGSDQGMVGRFNEGPAIEARKQAEKSRGSIFVLGARAASALASEGVAVEDEFSMAGSLNEAVDTVRDLLEHLGSMERLPAVYIIGNQPRGGSSYEVNSRRILPLDDLTLNKELSRPWEGRSIPMIRIPAEELFESISREYLFIVLYAALAESMASENAARLAAMQAAENNITEKEDEVRSLYNRQRQSSITSELLDIVGGFEALK